MAKKKGDRSAATVAGKRAGRGKGAKSEGQTKGHFERDPKRRTGHYTGAGEAPLMKK